jgi:hypothetical protein
MNERIKELIEQAEDYAAEQHAPYSHYERMLRYEVFKEKFAELIVKECVTIMTDASQSKLRLGDAIWNTKIHFGVK